MIHIIGIYHAMSMYYSDSLNFDRKKIYLIASIGSANAVEAYEWKKRQTWINQNDNRIEDNSENAVSLCFGNCIHIDGVDISFCSCYFQIYRFLSLFSMHFANAGDDLSCVQLFVAWLAWFCHFPSIVSAKSTKKYVMVVHFTSFFLLLIYIK